MDKPMIVFVMGVSGSGKSTIGSLLATNLNFPFFDGDDYHPEANIKKMSNGEPLNDTDRKGWLESLNEIAKKHQEKGAVIVCSALKQQYRDDLTKGLTNEYHFLYLKGTLEDISKRLLDRKGHFMPKALLQSQFETLEEPNAAVTLSILKSPAAIVAEFLKAVIT